MDAISKKRPQQKVELVKKVKELAKLKNNLNEDSKAIGTSQSAVQMSFENDMLMGHTDKKGVDR